MLKNMKNKVFKKLLVILQILILCISCFSFSVLATENQEEIATNPDVGWITIQALVDPNADTNVVRISFLNLDTGEMEYSCTLHKVNDFKDVVRFTSPGTYTIDSCKIENDPFFKFRCEHVEFEVVMGQNSLVTFNVGDPNAELITEPETETEEYLELEEVTKENEEQQTDITIIETPTENNNNQNTLNALKIALFVCFAVIGVATIGLILLIVFIKKRNRE